MFAPSKNTAAVSSSPNGPCLPRRALLTLLGGAAAGFLWAPALAANSGVAQMQVLDLEVSGFGEGFRRVRVLVPESSRGRSRSLVLLHGLGETHRPAQALSAWPTLYGAVEADVRLRCPPFAAPGKKARYWSESASAQFNADLAVRPYEGAVLICPRTPNPSLVADRRKLFDAYAAWLCDAVLPALEHRIPGATQHVGLDGCSLGGYVAAEVLVRRGHVFATGGGVQGAFAPHRLTHHVEGLTAVHRANPAFRFRVSTSLGDPYLDVGKELARRLTANAVPVDLDVVPGPHNQPWLCEIGTPRLLRWHDVTLPIVHAP